MSIEPYRKMVENPPRKEGLYWTGVPKNFFKIEVFIHERELIVRTPNSEGVNIDWIPLSDYDVSGWKWGEEPIRVLDPIPEPKNSVKQPVFENNENIDLQETIKSLEDSIKKAKENYAPYG